MVRAGWNFTVEDLRELERFEHYGYALENGSRYLQTLDLAAGFLSPSSRVLDLGMYPGHLGVLLRKKTGVSFTGLSYAHTAGFELRMGRAGITVIEADLSREPLPVSAASFDMVLCTEIIEHLDRPLPLLVAANRALRSGGVLILSTPNQASLAKRTSLLFGRSTNDHLFGTEHVYQMTEWVHRREYTMCELARLLGPVGFSVREVRYSTALDPFPSSLRSRAVNALKRLLDLRPSLKGTVMLAAVKTGEAGFTSLTPDLMQARLDVRSAGPKVAAPGEEVNIGLTVENTGNSLWLTGEESDYGYVRVGAHLLDGKGEIVDFDYLRSSLLCDIHPGESVDMELKFNAPRAPGTYALEIDLVNEGTSWFRNYRSPTRTVNVRVEGV